MQRSFPSFRLCRREVVRRCRHIMELDAPSRVQLARALLQVYHKKAAELLGESISPESEELLRCEQNYHDTHRSADIASDALRSRDDSKRATAQALKRAVAANFKVTFDGRCILATPTERLTDLDFRMECLGWMVRTWFEFGRWEPEIRVNQDIWTGRFITKEQPEVMQFNCIGFRLSYGNLLGIGSGWSGISIGEIDSVCGEVMKHCQRMFDVFPTLLNGLEFESLTHG